MSDILKTSLGRIYLTIDTDAGNRWLLAVWQGYLTTDSIRQGASAYILPLLEAGFCCILVDTRIVGGPWDHSMSWLTDEWGPKMAQAGLTHMAILTTPETLADGSAAAFYSQLKAFNIEIFANPDTARQWLRLYNK